MRAVDARLAALCAVLLIILAALWLLPGPPAQWRQWTQPEAQPPNLRDLESAVLQPNPAASTRYPQVLTRPLFSQSRRPPAAEPGAAEAKQAAPAPIDTARLLGIVAGPTLNGVMIEYEGKPGFVRQGEEIGGWKLASLADRTARFERGAESRELKLPVGLMQEAPSGAPSPATAANRPGATPSRNTPPGPPSGVPSTRQPAPPRSPAGAGTSQPAASSPGVAAQFGG